MTYTEAILCPEFRMVVQQILDGVDFSETLRREIRSHRDVCESCAQYHNMLLQLTAVTSEIVLPAEYQGQDNTLLWREILKNVDHEQFDQPGIAQGKHGGNGNGNGNTAVQAQPAKRLFYINDNDMDEIFGRCIVQPPQHKRVIGSRDLGRLDATKIEQEVEPPGNISDLGKFLVSPDELQMLRSLIETEESRTGISQVSASAAEAFGRLHAYLGESPKVCGTLLIAPDGTILSSMLRPDMDRDLLCVWSLCSYHNAQMACQAMGHSVVNQLVSKTANGYVVIAKVQNMTLVAIIDGDQPDLMDLMRRVQLISQ